MTYQRYSLARMKVVWYRSNATMIPLVAMPNLTLRDVPLGLHTWLREQARRHQRSLNKEIVALLEEARDRGGSGPARASAEVILENGRRAAALPVRDRSTEDEILGYGKDGLPG